MVNKSNRLSMYIIKSLGYQINIVYPHKQDRNRRCKRQ